MSWIFNLLFIDIMGNNQPKKLQESKFASQHPNLNDAKLVVEEKNHKYIEAKFKAQNTQYEEWNKHFKGPNKIQSDYLLLPEHAEFKSDFGLCGNTGTLTVSCTLSRLSIPTSPTYYPNSSNKDNPRDNSSRNHNYGFYCSHWQLPSRISRSTAEK